MDVPFTNNERSAVASDDLPLHQWEKWNTPLRRVRRFPGVLTFHVFPGFPKRHRVGLRGCFLDEARCDLLPRLEREIFCVREKRLLSGANAEAM
jgi:hypothetical protein